MQVNTRQVNRVTRTNYTCSVSPYISGTYTLANRYQRILNTLTSPRNDNIDNNIPRCAAAAAAYGTHDRDREKKSVVVVVILHKILSVYIIQVSTDCV